MKIKNVQSIIYLNIYVCSNVHIPNHINLIQLIYIDIDTYEYEK